MGIDYGSLKYTEKVLGASAEHYCASERALISFLAEDGELPIFVVKLSIPQHRQGMERLPSLVGTDVLRRLRIRWDYSQQVLEFEVISYDYDLGTFTREWEPFRF